MRLLTAFPEIVPNRRSSSRSRCLAVLFATALVFGAVLPFGVGNVVHAQYPEAPITVLVGFGVGGGIDTATRAIQPYFEKALGQNVLIVNRPGSTGLLATNAIYQTKPDGYTLMSHNPLNVIVGPYLYSDAALYESATEFTPIGGFVNNSGSAVFVGNNSPYQSLDDLIDAARQRNVTIGITGGLGSLNHFILVALREAKGGSWTMIVYQNSAELVAAVRGGHIQAGIGGLVGGTVNPDQLRFLASTTPVRGDVPTFADLGLPEIAYQLQIGILGPPGLDAELVAVLDRALEQAFHDPDFQRWAEAAGVGLGDYLNSEAYAKYIAEEERIVRELMPAILADVDAQ